MVILPFDGGWDPGSVQGGRCAPPPSAASAVKRPRSPGPNAAVSATRPARRSARHACGVPGTETLVAEVVLVERRIGEDWDERTREEVDAACMKRACDEEDLRAAPPASIAERFSRPPGR
jgi:hypothetical protein